MVLSDGYPATGDGRRAIGERGIELIGVGILNDAVETFYPASIVVETLHELPEREFKVLAGALLRR